MKSGAVPVRKSRAIAIAMKLPRPPSFSATLAYSRRPPPPRHPQDRRHDTIHPVTAEYIGRAIDGRRRISQSGGLIELNTPGGFSIQTEQITHNILTSACR